MTRNSKYISYFYSCNFLLKMIEATMDYTHEGGSEDENLMDVEMERDNIVHKVIALEKELDKQKNIIEKLWMILLPQNPYLN